MENQMPGLLTSGAGRALFFGGCGIVLYTYQDKSAVESPSTGIFTGFSYSIKLHCKFHGCFQVSLNFMFF
jgi:hypothetical protein